VILDVLAVVIVLPVAFITAFFAVELLFGLPRLRKGGASVEGASAVIVVPAHDEAAIIGETLLALKQAAGTVPILVIADNCTDSTAELARAEGVEVVERNEPERRGKGYALECAARHLEARAPDVVVVIDADCSIDGPSLRALIGKASASRLPAQAVNLLRPDRSRSPMVQLSTFGFMVKNLVRQRGLQRLAGQVHLTGTGMALPFELFRSARLASANVVEDLALGLELAARDRAPQLAGDAQVWSSGSTEEGTLTQRRRWEGGFLRTALRSAPQAIWNGLRRGDLRRAFGGLDLLIPPLALLALLNAAVLIAGGLLILLGARWWPVAAQIAILAAAALLVFIAWLREGREFISLAALARLPLYVAWKLPLYLGLGRKGAPRDWLRTGR
jgi:glycosyl transferase family 2